MILGWFATSVGRLRGTGGLTQAPCVFVDCEFGCGKAIEHARRELERQQREDEERELTEAMRVW